MNARHLFAGAAMLVSVCGCGPFGRAGHPVARPTVVLRVENRHWEDVTVFIVRHGASLNLGVVKAMSTQRFSVPDSHLGSGLGVRLMAQSFASRITHLSHEMSVPSGGSVDWTVEGRLTQSSFQIRPRL